MNLIPQIADTLRNWFEPDQRVTSEQYTGDLPDGWTFTCTVSVHPMYHTEVRPGPIPEEVDHYMNTLWEVDDLRIYPPDSDEFTTPQTEDYNQLIKLLQ